MTWCSINFDQHPVCFLAEERKYRTRPPSSISGSCCIPGHSRFLPHNSTCSGGGIFAPKSSEDVPHGRDNKGRLSILLFIRIQTWYLNMRLKQETSLFSCAMNVPLVVRYLLNSEKYHNFSSPMTTNFSVQPVYKYFNFLFSIARNASYRRLGGRTNCSRCFSYFHRSIPVLHCRCARLPWRMKIGIRHTM